MQELFTSDGESRAHLRFPEFRNGTEWIRRAMSELVTKVSRSVSVNADVMYREIGVRSHGKGIFHKESVNGKSIGNKRVFWVEPNALVVNIIFAWEQAVATTSNGEAGMIASHRFPMYVAKDARCDVRFLKHAFLRPEGKHRLSLASPGGAGRNRTLGQAEFEKLELVIPESVQEQTAVADVLDSADTLIAAEAEKLEALRTHKKGLMQRLFPSSEG